MVLEMERNDFRELVYDVLILIFLEDGLGDYGKSCYKARKEVLILIFLEDGLGGVETEREIPKLKLS